MCNRPSAIDYLACDILESVLDCFHVPGFGTLIPGAPSTKYLVIRSEP